MRSLGSRTRYPPPGMTTGMNPGGPGITKGFSPGFASAISTFWVEVGLVVVWSRAPAIVVGFNSEEDGVVVFGGVGVVFGFFTFDVFGFLVEIGFLGALVGFGGEVGFFGALVGFGGLASVALASVSASDDSSGLFVDSSVVVVILVAVVTSGTEVVAFGVEGSAFG